MLSRGDRKMNPVELLLLAVGLSMDAFAIAMCKGLSVKELETKHLLLAGLWFGGAQALMPLLGFLLGTGFRETVESIDHWIAFTLLVLIGINMIRESGNGIEDLNASFAAKTMLPLAIASSIDALAVGVGLSFLDVDIVPVMILIGITTFLLSALGVKIGNRFGARYKSKAELAGGVILIVMGAAILIEHLGVL
jgi:putative Mn2+ efflux pump MntP